jgi:GTP pyrophosphokinase
MHADLIKKIKIYDPHVDETLIIQAYLFSMKAHESQKRASGEPYFIHPVEVANILADMKLDTATIITGLLHDTVEDTSATLEEIQQLFGEEIAFLVDGVTKLTRIELQSDKTKQADNFRKLFLAMSSDLRVLIVKLADRLHNMKTLHYIPSQEKRKEKALETMEIFVPLAERIGMQEIKNELENLSFQELNPEAYESVLEKLSFLNQEGKNLVGVIIEDLKKTLNQYNFPFTILGRGKTPYSIWCKMVKKNVDFDQLPDIMAFRIIVEDCSNAYKVLGIIHQAYPAIPNRFKDYISTPKPNGYQSLHTTIIGPKQHRIEVQIRTEEMNYVSELGVAAHRDYKEGTLLTHKKHYRWLKGLLDILEQSSSPEEFLEYTKLEMFQDQVFCFSLKGDLIALPQGATPIDFAYAMSSEIGDQCVSAKVNSQIVPLKTILKNGDQVEIVTSITQHPLPIWENYTVTGKARARVRNYIRSDKHKKSIELGRSILRKVLIGQGYFYEEEHFKKILKQLNLPTLNDLYIAISKGHIKVLDIIYNLYTLSDKKVNFSKKTSLPSSLSTPSPLPIKGLTSDMSIHLAPCCYPLPGDKIIGQVLPNKVVNVHHLDCEKLEKPPLYPQGWIELSWTEFADSIGNYTAPMKIKLDNKPGTLGQVTTEIGKYNANIIHIKMLERTTAFFDITINVEVKDSAHLENIMKELRTLEIVHLVERIKH